MYPLPPYETHLTIHHDTTLPRETRKSRTLKSKERVQSHQDQERDAPSSLSPRLCVKRRKSHHTEGGDHGAKFKAKTERTVCRALPSMPQSTHTPLSPGRMPCRLQSRRRAGCDYVSQLHTRLMKRYVACLYSMNVCMYVCMYICLLLEPAAAPPVGEDNVGTKISRRNRPV
jgi:hypothetical protein